MDTLRKKLNALKRQEFTQLVCNDKDGRVGATVNLTKLEDGTPAFCCDGKFMHSKTGANVLAIAAWMELYDDDPANWQIIPHPKQDYPTHEEFPSASSQERMLEYLRRKQLEQYRAKHITGLSLAIICDLARCLWASNFWDDKRILACRKTAPSHLVKIQKLKRLEKLGYVELYYTGIYQFTEAGRQLAEQLNEPHWYE